VKGAHAQRRRLVEIGRLLYDRQHVVAAQGNLSVKLGNDHFLATPSGRCKGWLAPADLVEIRADGTPRRGEGRATSEWQLHREIYAQRADVFAICHAHSPFSTACAAVGLALDCRVLIEAALLLGDVPVAEPAIPGTPAVAASIRHLIRDHDAVLLGNHGVVAVGADLEAAFFRLESVEHLAQVTLLAAAAGGPRLLSEDLARAVRSAREVRGVGGHGRETDTDHRGQDKQE
jgi:L-fuculose-phosphate aldolase